MQENSYEDKCTDMQNVLKPGAIHQTQFGVLAKNQYQIFLTIGPTANLKFVSQYINQACIACPQMPVAPYTHLGFLVQIPIIVKISAHSNPVNNICEQHIGCLSDQQTPIKPSCGNFLGAPINFALRQELTTTIVRTWRTSDSHLQVKICTDRFTRPTNTFPNTTKAHIKIGT